MDDTGRPVPRVVIRSSAIGLTLVLLAACVADRGDIGEPNIQPSLTDSIVLAPGQEVRIQLLRLAFLEVSDDSRCPIDAMCVWQGNAAVEIALAIGMGPSHPFTLHTAYGSPAAEHGGYRVTLVSLTPVPRAAVPVPPDWYRAAVRVELID